MKKLLYTVVLILGLVNCLYPQDLKLGFTTGIGTYSMTGLKSINEYIPQNLPFDTELISDFPPYLYYQPTLVVKFAAFSVGLVYTFQSTGSRISAKDYSAEYRFDMKVKSHNPNIYGEFNLLSKNKYHFSVYSGAGLVFSNLEMINYFNLQDSVVNDATNGFKAMNYYLEPGLKATYSFTPKMSAGINAGYLVQLGSKGFYEENEKENKLMDPTNYNQVKPEWDGFRFGISLFYNIITKAK